MPPTPMFRSEIQTLEEQYLRRTLSQTEIVERVAELMSKEPPENFVENTRYVCQTMGRPGHALATGSTSITVDAETRRYMLEILDAWSSNQAATLFKEAGHAVKRGYLGYEHEKHVKANPDPNHDALQVQVEKYQQLPIEDNLNSFKAIVQQQRLLFSEVAERVPNMPQEHQHTVLQKIEYAVNDKFNRIMRRFAQREWRAGHFNEADHRAELDIYVAEKLGNAIYAHAQSSPEQEQRWKKTQREQFRWIVSGCDLMDPIPMATPQPEVAPAPRKPKGPR